MLKLVVAFCSFMIFHNSGQDKNLSVLLLDLCYAFFFVIKPTRCTNFTNLFCHEILHVSDSSSVHHKEFIHCTLSNGICRTGL